MLKSPTQALISKNYVCGNGGSENGIMQGLCVHDNSRDYPLGLITDLWGCLQVGAT